MKKKIGQIIKEKVKEKKLSAAEFAELLNTERTNVYNIFKRENIDTGLLKKIGQILEYDFFQEFLAPETLQELKIQNAMTRRILVELELEETEIMKIGFKEKKVIILNIK
jgi:transcriptional regulator with XRE-family HTH domain